MKAAILLFCAIFLSPGLSHWYGAESEINNPAQTQQPETRVPKELTQGVWAAMNSQGTSTLQFLDKEQGRLKQWDLIENYSSSCTWKYIFFTEGKVEFKGNIFTFYPHNSKIEVSKTDCPSPKTESSQGNIKIQSFMWELVKDDNGSLLYVYDSQNDQAMVYENIETPAQFPIPVPEELVAARKIQEPFSTTLSVVVPLSLVLGAFFAWPLSLWLLYKYRAAVKKTMYTGSEEEAEVVLARDHKVSKESGVGIGGSLTKKHISEKPGSQGLLLRLMRGPRDFAGIHVLAGAVYALLFSLIDQRSLGLLEFLPGRLLSHFLIVFWPVIIQLILIIGKRTTNLIIPGGYFALYFLLSYYQISNSPDINWFNMVNLWRLYNFIPSILILTFLYRKIRAIGPLVFIFTSLAVLGLLSISVMGGIDPKFTGSMAEVFLRWGLPLYAVIIVFHFIGFFIFSLIGAAILVIIRNRYQKKKISDQAIISGSIWFIFALSYSTGVLISSGIDWLLISLLPIFIYFIIVKIGYLLAARRQREVPATNLLFLRSFSLEKRSRQLFDKISRHWRFAGSIQLIAGPDLAESTIQPHEFLDFMSGKLSRRFIKNSADLEVRLQEMDTRPDNDSLYRINDFFCYDNIWKKVLSSLVGLSDAVVMDLREFTRERKGCEYEIRELLQVYPMSKTLFVIDDTTDLEFVHHIFNDTRKELPPTSPNTDLTAEDIKLFKLKNYSDPTIDLLLKELATAAGGSTLKDGKLAYSSKGSI